MGDIHLQNKHGYLYFSCGASLNKDGERKNVKHCLGKDRHMAMLKANALDWAWRTETAADPKTGLKIWSTGAVEAAIRFVTAAVPTPAIPTPPKAEQVMATEVYVPPPPSYTLAAAFDAFVEWHNKRMDISERWRMGVDNIVTSLKYAIEHSPEHPRGLDDQISAIGQQQLDSLRNLVLSRPISRQQRNDGGKPISMDTVCGWLKVLGMAFDHFQSFERYGWKAPAGEWRKTFQLNRKQKWALMSSDERYSHGTPADIYTIQQVSEIYRQSSDTTKPYILLAVALGWGQEAISSFRKDEMVKVGDDYFIERRRQKTGVLGKWWIAPELAQMLIKTMQQTPPNEDNLAFLTWNGLPLCHRPKEGGKYLTDNVAQAWERCLNATYGTPGTRKCQDVQRLSFGKLRKLGGQLIQNFSGSHELAQLHLCHMPQTIASRHYVFAENKTGVGMSLQERLFAAQKELWQEIRPLFFPVALGTAPATLANPQSIAA